MQLLAIAVCMACCCHFSASLLFGRKAAGVSTPKQLGAKTTAKEVIERFGEGMYLAGKTAIVTGGNSGIGLETCKALALAGCRVIMCSRDEDAAEAAIKLEVQQPGLGGYAVDGGNIAVRKLDLSSLGSIKAFAEVFKATEERLDFLILNAGIMALPKREETEHGWEKQIAVNHFGHFYLTQLLQEKMAASPYTAGRIVVLASSAHQFGQVKTEDLHYTKGRRYRSWEAYGQSKLANLLFAKGLADHLKDSGDANTRKLTAVAVHPGVIKTNLWRASRLNRLASRLITSKTIPQGAATTVYATVAPRPGDETLRGAYLDNCGPTLPSPTGRDTDKILRNALWETTSEQLSQALAKMALTVVDESI